MLLGIAVVEFLRGLWGEAVGEGRLRASGLWLVWFFCSFDRFGFRGLRGFPFDDRVLLRSS